MSRMTADDKFDYRAVALELIRPNRSSAHIGKKGEVAPVGPELSLLSEQPPTADDKPAAPLV